MFLCSLNDNLRLREFSLPIKKEVKKFFFFYFFSPNLSVSERISFLFSNNLMRAKSQTAGNHSRDLNYYHDHLGLIRQNVFFSILKPDTC